MAFGRSRKGDRTQPRAASLGAAAVGEMDTRYALAPQRAVTLDGARRHSRNVRSLRRFLLAAMATLAGAVFTFVVIHSVTGDDVLDEPQEAGVARMVNPRFTGQDGASTPYVITADAAVREVGDLSRTELEGPRLVVEGEEENGSEVLAKWGIYDRDENTLDLIGDVVFRTNNGYAFTTSHARVFVDEQRVVGWRPVRGEGPLGRVDANSFQVLDGGRRIVFRRDVVARVEQEPRLAPPLVDEGEAPVEPES